MIEVAPKKYNEQLMDVHNPGVLEVFLGTDQECYTGKVVRRHPPLINMFYAIVFTLGWVATLVLLYITWRKQMAVLQQVKYTMQMRTSGDVGMHCLHGCLLPTCTWQ